MASLREGQVESTICPADMTLTGSPETTTSVKGESVASDSTESWSLGMPERTLQILYLPGFDILSVDESSWLGRGRDPTSTTSSPSPEAARASPTHCGEEPEQCPQIHSSVLVDPVTQAGQDEERSLEQMQTLVVEEVLKDIETACKLLNITPDPVDWNSGNVQKWLLWTEHLYKLPTVGQAFQQLDGKDLCAMSPEDFHKLCPEYGDTLHAHLDIWKSAAWMHGRCSVTNRPSTGGCQDAWPEADSSCSGQPVHLWQFLRELLLKPHNYSRYIRWLNKDKGIFKIEDSAQVARLWGQRKNRPAMNYDKLSRSIRQYYKKGIIRKPDMSQRLVYQFVNPV